MPSAEASPPPSSPEEELEQAREALRVSEDRFRSMVEATSDWLWEVDTSGIYTYSSPRVNDLLGYEPVEILGRPCFEFIAERERERVRTSFSRAVSQRAPFHGLVNPCLHRDGSEIVLETSGVPVLDDAGEMVGYRGIDRDITARVRAEEALRESEATLRSLIQAAPAAVGLVIDRVFQWVNDRFGELIGRSPAELEGQSARLVYASDEEYERVGRVKYAQVREHGMGHVETTFLRRDGSTVDVLLSSSALDPSDLSRGVVFTALDITARKEAERTLRASEERFRLLYEGSPIAYQALDAEARCVSVNPAWVELSGYSREESLGRPFPSFLASASAAIFVERYEALKAGEECHGVELEVVRKGGATRTVTVDAALGRGPDGDEVHCVLHDVTASRQAAAEVEHLQAMLGAAIEQSPAGILVADAPDVRIRVANSAALGIRGETNEPLVDIPAGLHPRHWQIHHPDGKPVDAEELPLTRAVRHGERSETEEYIIRRTDGEDRWILANAAPVRSADGEIVAGVVVFSDITELRSLEAQLRQSQKMEAIGQLAGGVAHDFNNQLTVITGYTEILLRKMVEGDPLRLPLEEIRRAGDRAKQLTSQLLAFGRKQVLKPVLLDLGDVLAAMRNPLRRMVGEQIEIVMEADDPLEMVRLDRSQIEQAVMNLVINARDAMPQGGRMTLETRNVDLPPPRRSGEPDTPTGPHVEVVVRDTGTGMDERTLEQIFDPFFTTKEVGEGTGLGLAMVYGFVKQSGGSVRVESAPDHGTTFRLDFPVAAHTDEEEAEAEAADAALGGEETILVAEDEESVRGIIVQVLRGRGYQVLETADPREALEVGRALGTRVDLLVTDVVMPGMHGPKLAERLRSASPGLRVLFVSGYASDWARRMGGVPPGSRLLRKPFKTRELAEAVRGVLDDVPAST